MPQFPSTQNGPKGSHLTGFSEKKEAKLLAWWLAHSINGSYYYYLTHRALEAQRRKLPGGHSARGTQADVWEDG